MSESMLCWWSASNRTTTNSSCHRSEETCDASPAVRRGWSLEPGMQKEATQRQQEAHRTVNSKRTRLQLLLTQLYISNHRNAH
ncbi:hypothetical protein EYF80_019216 [Liparis tanakae]|uniref:Uncharacterized protein n=1 Tax=Liparis tanakae TaxID=230148 RepID=A0A4Z2I077_9TELE|nr:hypothetical protein EYF80_019216 [Liparis tanakae]